MNFGSVALEQTALINSYCYFSFIANLYLLESQYMETLSLLDYVSSVQYHNERKLNIPVM